MLIADAKQLTPVERFLYWCGERHRIYGRKQAGLPKPWTDDEILQQFYFTNVYRELDRTTVWFREHIRDPRAADPSVIFATICFRWFNLIHTGVILDAGGWLDRWKIDEVLAVLSAHREARQQIFTGAFMINSPPGERKLEAVCARIDAVWRDINALCIRAKAWTTMEAAHADLLRYVGLGGFMAYEIVCDLRYTHVLTNATDISTWSNPGPGAVRGLYRVMGREIPNKSNATAPPAPADWNEQISWLLGLLKGRYPDMPPFEAREVEMALCEVDKYNRLLFAEGKSKRRYDGGGEPTPTGGLFEDHRST